MARELLRFLVQTAASWGVLAFLSVILIGVTNAPYDGFVSFVGWTVTVVLFPILTNVLVVVLGLPFRLVGGLRAVLATYGAVPLIVGIAGLVCVIVSFLLRSPQVELIDGLRYNTYELPTGPFLAGWLMTAAGIVHATPPFRLGGRRPGEGGRDASGASRTLGA